MNHGFLRIFKVIAFSYAGLKLLWRSEEAFRQELIAGIIGFTVLYYLGAENLNLAIFVSLMLVLFSAEALNTGLEYIADKIDSSKNDFTRDVKDLGAVAVFFVMVIPFAWFIYLVCELV